MICRWVKDADCVGGYFHVAECWGGAIHPGGCTCGRSERSDQNYGKRLDAWLDASRACAIGAAPVAQAVNSQSRGEE
jgi:hypothetical protein